MIFMQPATPSLPSADFLIVTALPKERDAVLQLLENPQQIQVEGSPTYYVSSLLPYSKDGAYLVALTMLNQMGNVEAAQHTTRAINDLKPDVVLMVGIAGGIKEAVILGDVIIATQVIYYEQVKQGPDGSDERLQSYQVDAHLLDRAQNYLGRTWLELISEARPNNDEHQTPKVKFGPIAAGEKIITDPALVQRLRRSHSKLVGVEMESFGVVTATANDRDRPRFLAIRGVCDYADPNKGDDWQAYAASAAAAFTLGFLRSGPITPKVVRAEKALNAIQKAKTLIAIRHQSMERISTRAITSSLPVQFEDFNIEELLIDQTDLYLNGRLVDPVEAVHRQSDLPQRLEELLRTYPNSEIAYYGIAHIPLLFLAGYHLSNKQVIHLFEHNRRTSEWNQLQGGGTIPDLKLEEEPSKISRDPGDVILRVSISYAVNEEDVTAIVLDPIASLHLRLKVPTLDAVTSEHQIQQYSVTFRRVLDQIVKCLPRARRLHMFFAGPASLAFNFGRQISKTVHPNIVVYNYMQRDKPHYSWGLEITSDVSPGNFLVTPRLERE